MEVFLITTSEHTQRHERAQATMNAQFPMPYIPIMAVDYRIMQYGGLQRNQARHMSLTLAYRQIAQHMALEGIRRAVICEDDIWFIAATIWPEISEACEIAKIDKKAGVFYLTQTDHNEATAKNGGCEPCNHYFQRIINNWWETPITMWTLEFARYFDQYIGKKLETELNTGNIDHELMKICESGAFNFYGATTKTAIGLSSAKGQPEAAEFDFTGSLSEQE